MVVHILKMRYPFNMIFCYHLCWYSDQMWLLINGDVLVCIVKLDFLCRQRGEIGISQYESFHKNICGKNWLDKQHPKLPLFSFDYTLTYVCKAKCRHLAQM